jgi:hypothetical protein
MIQVVKLGERGGLQHFNMMVRNVQPVSRRIAHA